MTKGKADLRLLHLADVHLGASFPWLGERGTAHRRRLRQTFSDAVQRALDESVHLVLIAGDLFATSHPHPDLTEFVAAQFGRLKAAGTEVVIAAGEADALDAHGVYAGGAFEGLAGVTVLPAAPKVVDFPAHGLAVCGRSMARAARDITDPFKGLNAGRQPLSVALVALELTRVGWRETLTRAVAGSRFAYLALGGSHKTQEAGSEVVPAWFPGSLELLARSEAPGAALRVDLGGETPVVTPVPLARGRVQRMTLEPAAFDTSEALVAEIEAAADADLSLEVRLAGRAGPAQFIDTVQVERRLAPRFFSLEIIDEAMPDLAALTPPAARAITVRGKFAELMNQQLQQAGSEVERRRIGRAYRLGLWLLQQRREVV